MEEQGFYLESTVINAIADDMLCMVEENFGPVAPIATFKELDEVNDRANNSPLVLQRTCSLKTLTKQSY